MSTHSHTLFNFTEKLLASPIMMGEDKHLSSFAVDSSFMRAFVYLLAGPWAGHNVGFLGRIAQDTDLPASVSKMVNGTRPEKMIQAGWSKSDQRIGVVRGYFFRDVLSKRGVSTFREETVSMLDKQGRMQSFNRHKESRLDFSSWKTSVYDMNNVIIVNLDREEFLSPAAFGDKTTLFDVAESGNGGTYTALAVLLAASCAGGARGEGDIDSTSPLVGSWAGDRVGIYTCDTNPALSDLTNVSASVRDVMMESNFGADFFMDDNGNIARAFGAEK